MLTYTIKMDVADAPAFKEKLFSIEPTAGYLRRDLHTSDAHVSYIELLISEDTYVILRLAFPFQDMTERTPEAEARRWLRHGK